ncbi:hypothetical protein HYS91_05870 [Candidatus Daviesbacteria bacterium]|nr:hypothetical protein [Candidatus Daviesbacteria bacterium]
MFGQSGNFKELFKKYRLKAEIPTLSKFGQILSEKGFNYEDSIFSHWQKGSRIPQYRTILLKLLEIFVERGAIASQEQANEFLVSANQGYLSEKETQKLNLNSMDRVFQVPNEITNFTGREKIIKELTFKQDIKGKVILIHGPAGVGKTVLAIKLGHLLQSKYSGGIFWYKVEEDNIMDILLSIAKTLGEDISNIADLQVRGTVVRSLLASKNVLLFLDSAELSDKINLLIPNSKACTTIITSQKSSLKIPIKFLEIGLAAFNNDEVLALFTDVLKEKFPKVSKNNLLKVAKSVGNLPLAVHILARNLSQRKVPVSGSLLLADLYEKQESLDSAISLSYNKLDTLKKSVLVSASIFKGKDFLAKSIGYINGLSVPATITILQSLVNLSLLEHSTKNRYRIHPAIKDFVREKLDYPRSSYLQFIAILIFVFFIGWWIILQLPSTNNPYSRLIFAASYFVMALYGGIFGLNASFNWGGIKTLLGRAILMFSLGLFMQVFGQLIYAYYNRYLNVPVPYPSVGDIGYFGTIPFYTYGVFLLAKSSGIQVSFRSFRKKIIAMVIPTIMLTFGYLLFLSDYTFDFNNPIKIFLDFGYPLGEAIYISIAIITFIFSRTVLDGIIRSKALFILVALIVQFTADYVFLLTSDGYYPGNYIELIYLTAYFIMTLALLSLKSINIKVY